MDKRLIIGLVFVGILLLLVSEELPPRINFINFAVFVSLCYGLNAWSNRSKDWTLKPNINIPTINLKQPTVAHPREKELNEIASLTKIEAENKVNYNLGSSDRWITLGGNTDKKVTLTKLPDYIQTFFEKYPGIEEKNGGARISLVDVTPFKWPTSIAIPFGSESKTKDRTYIQIGVDYNNDPVMSDPESDRVLVVHGYRQNADKWWFSEYSTLYHWILTAETRLKKE